MDTSESSDFTHREVLGHVEFRPPLIVEDDLLRAGEPHRCAIDVDGGLGTHERSMPVRTPHRDAGRMCAWVVDDRRSMSEVKIDVYETSTGEKNVWWLLLISGLLSLLFGAALVFWPEATIVAVTTLVGLYMIVTGSIRFLVAVFGSDVESRWPMAIVGSVGIVIGVIVMKNPEGTIKIIALIAGLFWLFAGLVDLFRGITDSTMPDRTLRIVSGLVSIALGVTVLAWPEITITVFAIMVGIYASLMGVLQIIAAFQIRKAYS